MNASDAARGLAMVLACAFVPLIAGCMEYRQTSSGVTPATSCPDMAHGCGKTQVNLLYVIRLGEPPRAQCGTVGMAEVTTRSQPLQTAISVVTLGLVSPRRIEWKCARPDPEAGGGIVPASAPASPAN